MKINPLIAMTLVGGLICAVGFGVVAIGQQQQKVRQVNRVARPVFKEADWKGVYFENAMKDGLVGARPEVVESTATAVAANDTSESAQGEFAWSRVVSSSTLEDEAKSLLQKLNTDLTSPVKFRTSYNDVNQTFAELSLVFAVIQQYDGEVRWKDDAPKVFAALRKATIASRSSEEKSYAYCNQRKFELTDLIRGEAFPEVEKTSDSIDWSNVIDRNPAMVRLETSDEQIKQWTADKSEFESNSEKILHESEWVAAISEVIAMEGMDDAEDDGYLEFCKLMGDAALQTVDAAKTNNYDKAAKFANLMSQSCSNCHEDWRARP